MGHSRSRKNSRQGVTRSKLLPLSGAMVQATSLQNHLALEALRSRHGASLHVTFLFRAVYLTYLMSDVSDQSSEIDVFQEAEAALCRCSSRAEDQGAWHLNDVEIEALKTVLSLHDWQLQTVPAHRYESSCAHLLNFVMDGDRSVIPALIPACEIAD